MYKEIKGDAVEYFKQYEGNCALVHQVNAQGVMASGIAKQIREKFPEHYRDYIECYNSASSLELGDLIETTIKDYSENNYKTLFGIVSQNQYGKDGKRYTNYAALFNGILGIALSGEYDMIIIPKYIGCGLGGGDYYVVESFLKDLSAGYGVNIIVVGRV